MARDAGADGELNDEYITMFPAAMAQDTFLRDAVTPFMLSAIRYGIEGYGPDYYLDLCASGKAELWGGFKGSGLMGIIVTMKVDYSQFSVLRVIMCAGVPGSLEKFGALAWDRLCQCARHMGASHIEAWGRPGWESALSKFAKPEKKVEVLSYKVPV